MAQVREHPLRHYYEQNTAPFLWLSGGNSTNSLHRPVWAPSVERRDEAFAYPYRLVLRELQEIARETRKEASVPSGAEATADRDPFRVLDLGCGVGGGVHYLLEHFDGPLHATGITLSPTQVDRARGEAEARGFDPNRYSFLEGNFHRLPDLEPVDVAFAIESFALSERPDDVLGQIARVLRPGGRLVLIDDFFREPPSDRHTSMRQNRWIQTVREGWHAHGLRAVGTILQKAETHGLRPVRNANLTPYLRFGRPRDRLIRWFVVPLRGILWRWPYFRGLIGGDALQKCLQAEIMEYRQLVFERK